MSTSQAPHDRPLAGSPTAAPAQTVPKIGGSSLAGSLASATAPEQLQRDTDAAKSPSQIAESGFRGAWVELPYRSELEASFGTDLAFVHVFTDEHAQAAANQLGAKAYALGSRIAFATTNPAKSLVAHEVTHVLQHTGRGPARPASGAAANGLDMAGEPEAEHVERSVADGKPARAALANDVPQLDLGGSQPSTKLAPARSAADFATGMSFSEDSFKKDFSYTLWSGTGISIPVVAVPGLFFNIEPSVSISLGVEVDWSKEELSVPLALAGGVGFTLSYGNKALADVYGGFFTSAGGSFTYSRSKDSWSLAGDLSLSGNIAFGARVGGGVLDVKYELGSLTLVSFASMRWDNGAFSLSEPVWAPEIDSAMNEVRFVIDQASSLVNAGIEITQETWGKATEVGESIWEAGGDFLDWVNPF